MSVVDISFLLTFLRVRYFSQLEARKLLDNFVTRRTKFSQWFKNLDPADPKIQDVYNRGYVHVHCALKKCTSLRFRRAATKRAQPMQSTSLIRLSERPIRTSDRPRDGLIRLKPRSHTARCRALPLKPCRAVTRGKARLPRVAARQRASNYMQMICRYMSTKWRRL